MTTETQRLLAEIDGWTKMDKGRDGTYGFDHTCRAGKVPDYNDLNILFALAERELRAFRILKVEKYYKVEIDGRKDIRLGPGDNHTSLQDALAEAIIKGAV